jgi:hypothetical protein
MLVRVLSHFFADFLSQSLSSKFSPSFIALVLLYVGVMLRAPLFSLFHSIL